MGRSPCSEKAGLKKGPWTPEEDQKLLAYIEEYGHGSWRALPAKAGLQRCGKSCRLRWTNYLRPDINRGKFSMLEEQSIIQLHALLGNRWSAIATRLPKRTDNEIKNYWNTHLKKQLVKMGIDPVTHKLKSDASAQGRSRSTANLSHIAQWETARLEAEARLVRESKLGSNAPQHVPTVTTPTSPCLDVLRAWRSVLSTTEAYNTQGSSHIIDLPSPISTLSFTENNIMPPTIQGRMLGFSLNAEAFIATAEANSWLFGPSGGRVSAGFTEMLLDNANEQNTTECCDESDYNIEGESCVDMEEGEGVWEENKNYWSNILSLVNISSPPTSPPPPVY